MSFTVQHSCGVCGWTEQDTRGILETPSGWERLRVEIGRTMVFHDDICGRCQNRMKDVFAKVGTSDAALANVKP